MPKLLGITATFGLAIFGLIAAWFAAGALADEPPLREIFVPFADLHVLLAGDDQRAFMSRAIGRRRMRGSGCSTRWSFRHAPKVRGW